MTKYFIPDFIQDLPLGIYFYGFGFGIAIAATNSVGAPTKYFTGLGIMILAVLVSFLAYKKTKR